MNIGQNIKLLRNQHNLTQAELAYSIGITQSKLSALEKNKNNPSFTTLVALKDFFNITYDELITNTIHTTSTKYLTTTEKELLSLYYNLPEKEQYKLLGRLEHLVEQYKTK